MISKFRHAFVITLVIASFASMRSSSAGDLSKEECVDAHSKGQDAKEQGKLSLARKLFLACAQPSCPTVVQSDCARFADDLTRIQPSLTFAARDSSGADLPDTAVYVDNSLVLTRLDGQPHDVDPGTHTVKFTSDGKNRVVTVVVGSGEKGRAVVATFKSANAGGGSGDRALTGDLSSKTITTHPTGSRVLIGTGAALVVTGVVLGVVGLHKIPGNCSFSTRECAAAPGDPSIAEAASGVRIADYGMVAGGIGLAALAGGVYWYIHSAKTVTRETNVVAAPWISNQSSGIALSGHF